MEHDRYKMEKPEKYRSFPDDEKEKLLKKLPPIKFRWDWGALPPSQPDVYYRFPLSTVIFTYTGGEECRTEEDCVNLVKEIQRRDMNERGLPDIQYSFYIGNDGKIYEGRGFLVKSIKDPEFAHLTDTSFDIAYMGDFSDKEPHVGPLKLGKKLMRFLHDHRVLGDNYNIISLEKTREMKGIITKVLDS